MSEPTTAAGRALVRALAGLSLGGDGLENAEDVQVTVHRIEAEARATAWKEALAVAEDAVRNHTGKYPALAAIDALRERSGE